MIKKLLTSGILITFILANGLQAFEPFSRKPVDMTKEFTPISGDIQVDYQDITAKNAGKIINSWKGKNNFKSRIILTGGVFLDLNQDKLNESNLKVQNFQQKLVDLAKNNKSSGKLEMLEPEMIQYPDRISIKQDYKIVFENKKEFDNFQKFVGTGSDIQKTISKTLSDKQTKGIEKLISECKQEGFCKTSTEEKDMRIKLIKALIDGKKTISFTEQINYNLIPLDIGNLNEVNSSSFNLKLDPKDVRINKNLIKERFNKINIFNESIDNMKEIELNGSGVDLDKIVVKKASASSSSSSVNSRSTPEDYCSYYFMPQEDDYRQCVATKSSLDGQTLLEGSKLMLNGFTLGNSWSEDFNKVISIPKVRKPREDTVIFRARANRTFSYGVGLRIPFLVQTQVADKNVPQDRRVRYGVKMDTLDMSANQYSDLGLPSQHIFNGKEFVLEVKASVFAKVVLFGEDLINHTWGLGDLLPRDTPGRVSDGIDLGRNFKPPFGDQSRANLVDLTIPVPIVDIEVASAKIDLIIRSYIEGIMKANLYKTNFQGADLPIVFDNTQRKYYNFNGVYSEEPYKWDNVLGDIGKGIIVVKNFDYRPRLTFSFVAKPKLEVWIPGRGNESWSFGTYDIYSFQIDPGVGLTRHRGTDGEVRINTINIYKMNTQISEAKIADNERRARMERNAEIVGDASSSQGFTAEDLGMVDMYGNQYRSSSSASSRSTRQDGANGRVEDQEGMEVVGLIQQARDQAKNGSSSSSSSTFRNNYSLRQNENNYLLSGNLQSYYNPQSLSGVVLSGSKLSSKDTYVEDKLKEANDGFLEVYDDYLVTIENALNTFTQGMNSANDKMEKNKYQRAIDKVKEVKEIFLNRYKFIINYSKGIFTPQVVYVSESQLRDQFNNQFGTTPIDAGLGQNRNNSSNQGVPNRVKYHDIEYMSTKMPSCDKNDVKIGDLTWASCDSSPSSILGFSSFSYYNQSNALSSGCPTGYKLPSVSEIQTMLSGDITPADREFYGISEELYKKNKLLGYKEVLGLSIGGYLYEYDIPGWENMSQYEKDMATLMRLDLKIINGKVYKEAMFGSKYWTSDIGYVFNLDFISSLPFSEHGQNEIMGNVRCVRK